MQLQDIRTIAVLGAGQMGAGIAQVCATHGFVALLADVAVERANRAKLGIGSQLGRLVDKGKIAAEERQRILDNITATDSDDACAQADFIIEAATENRELKLEIFRKADARAKKSAILASNTSSLSITLIAGHTSRPEQVVGMHFMNPVPVMKLVEIVRGLQTSSETLELTRALALKFEKILIQSEDRPGFLVNRMLIPLLNEACFSVEQNIGSVEDIDQGARLGLNHPMGPLELADLVGLDTVLSIAEVLQRDLGDDKYRPACILRNLVAAGWLGKKTGRGFYRYDEKGQKLGRSF